MDEFGSHTFWSPRITLHLARTQFDSLEITWIQSIILCGIYLFIVIIEQIHFVSCFQEELYWRSKERHHNVISTTHQHLIVSSFCWFANKLVLFAKHIFVLDKKSDTNQEPPQWTHFCLCPIGQTQMIMCFPKNIAVATISQV